MDIIIRNTIDLKEFITDSKAAVIYFYVPDSNVCNELMLKLKQMLENDFPNLKLGYVNVYVARELAVKSSVNIVPTVLLIYEGKELLRESKNFSHQQLKHLFERPYTLLFG